MKFKNLSGWSSALFLSITMLQAQETKQLDVFSEKLKQLQEQQRQTQSRFEQIIKDQQAQIDALKKQLADMAGSGTVTNTAVATASTNLPPGVALAEDVESLKEQVNELTTISKRPSINQFNPGIGFVGDTIFSYTTKGSDKTGNDRPGGADVFFRTAELNLEASVDPFARAYGVIAASADPVTGEATLDVEEAAIVTTSLPWNLTLQGGRFFADFGRLSYVHDHDLPFVYRPLVLDKYIGGESQSDGAQLNYLFPTKQYVSLTVGLGNRFGGDTSPNFAGGYRSLNALNYWGHLSTYFDLTPNWSLEMGVSGLADARAQGIQGFSPTQRDRYIAAGDLTLRYQPLNSTVYRSFVWGTEVLGNSARFDPFPGAVSGRQNSAGLYSYVEEKLSRNWKIGFLFDWMQSPENPNINTYRYSPYVTWNPSEFQFVRLQYSHTDRDPLSGFESDDAIYLQWQFIIGRHVHGFKQR